MSYEEAACLLYTGLTTWCALTSAGGLNASNAADKNVLVIGGSGGVGNSAIQILKSWGAKVLYTLANRYRRISNEMIKLSPSTRLYYEANITILN